MLGGVAYLYPFALQEKIKKSLEWLGITLIIGSYILISKNSPWPGYLAIFPVLGAFLIIQAQQNDSFITSNIVSQKIGAWSYSIYLWHWPLVVGIYYFSLSDAYIYLGITLSVLLGYISNRYIEKIKFRNEFSRLFHYLKCKPLHLVLLVGLLGSYVFISKGVDNRFNLTSELKEINKELLMPLRTNGYCFYSFNDGQTVIDKNIGSNCYLGSKGKTSSTLLFGDSFAGHNEPFFDEVFKSNNASFQSIVTNWCTPSLTANFTGPKTNLAYKQCLINRAYLKENMHKYKNLIFAGHWSSMFNQGQFKDVELVIDKSAKMGANVFIMAAPYRYKKNPLQDFYRSIYFNHPFDIKNTYGNDTSVKKANIRLKKLAFKYENVYFIERNLLYTENNTFKINGINVPYSLDGEHISILGSKYSAKHFMSQGAYTEIIKHFNFN